MKNFVYKTRQLLPVSIEQAWNFFSSPFNLAEITPGHLDFQITGNTSTEIFEGMIIEYRLKPLGNLPVRWRSLIYDVIGHLALLISKSGLPIKCGYIGMFLKKPAAEYSFRMR